MLPTSNAEITTETRFRAIYADGNCLWKPLRRQGKGAWLCEVVDEGLDYGGTQKVFLESEIRQSLGWAEVFAQAANETDQFYNEIEVGSIIHYHSSHGQWLRCEIVSDEDVKYAKPIAMLGLWHKSDLPSRNRTGEINYCYHPDIILFPDKERPGTKKHWRPNVSSIYEAGFRAHPNFDPGDPRKLEPLDLSVPDMTTKEVETARKWRLIAKLHEIAEDHREDDPDKLLIAMKELLELA